MQTELSKKRFFPYLYFLSVILGLSILGASGITLGAILNHMDVPTFISSWNAKKVSAGELQQGKLKPIILIDVRSAEEYAEDHIGSSQLVPFSDIQAGFGIKTLRAIAQAGAKPNQLQPTLVLYCTAGPRSIKAYKQMEKTGLDFVVLAGGIKAWRQIVPASKDAEVLAPITATVMQTVRLKSASRK